MSKNRYLYEDLRDLEAAWNRLMLALLPAFKPLIVAATWLMSRPYLLAVLLSGLVAFLIVAYIAGW